MNAHDEVRRGEDAARLLASPLLREAWQHYDAVLLGLLADPDSPPEKAAEVRALLIAARKARGHLERLVTDGKWAAERIKQEEQRKTVPQRVRAAFR